MLCDSAAPCNIVISRIRTMIVNERVQLTDFRRGIYNLSLKSCDSLALFALRLSALLPLAPLEDNMLPVPHLGRYLLLKVLWFLYFATPNPVSSSVYGFLINPV
jgi:hypothetical protein